MLVFPVRGCRGGRDRQPPGRGEKGVGGRTLYWGEAKSREQGGWDGAVPPAAGGRGETLPQAVDVVREKGGATALGQA
ncbi:hypothetical protein BHE74_00043475 [Ensete ventricosum]|nr:hypothetical protein BHE74_00043475 [Ensete ventricosum]